MWTLVTTALSVPLIYFTINNASSVLSAWKFVYGTFLKPRAEDGDGSNPQAFLENKYKEQASEYDAIRSYFLPGREALLGLVAAQLSYRMDQPQSGSRKPIWIDVSKYLIAVDKLTELMTRLVVARAIMWRPCPNSFLFRTFSRESTWWI